MADHKVRDTLSFCIHRQGGYIQFGADPPTDPRTITTPMLNHNKYYSLKILDMKVLPCLLLPDNGCSRPQCR